MRKRNVRYGAVLLAMALIFSGCGQEFPEMTRAEEEAIGEYAARLLLKYDANHRSRLVDLAEVEMWEEEQKHKDTQKETEDVQKPGGMDPVADTPTVNMAGNTSSGGTTDNTVFSLEEFWDLPEGVQIIYSGYDVTDSMDNDFFSIDASEGKKLLLLHFQVNNRTSSERMVDILSQNTNIKVTVNGNYTKDTLTTMMTEDLSTYRDSIPAGGNVDTLLLIEVEQEVGDGITSISLKLKNDAKTYTIQLV